MATRDGARQMSIVGRTFIVRQRIGERTFLTEEQPLQILPDGLWERMIARFWEANPPASDKEYWGFYAVFNENSDLHLAFIDAVLADLDK